MNAMIRRVLNWLEDRTGVESAVKHFLYEDIPESAGWFQVLGSVALFAFLVQAFTGVLLAFNYAPTPGDAYNSLRYILTELTGGRVIRGLHHLGASRMIVGGVLPLGEGFLDGAYKKTRGATGRGGVGLLLLSRPPGLPPATIFRIALHIYLVRKHGVAPAPGEEERPKKQFYPVQVFKDTVAIFLAFAVLFTMAVAARVPLEQLADPTDTSYTPRPEWY